MMASSKQFQGKKNQAKDVIAALCHILNSHSSITRITPEQFRQAKFDQPEAISSMWLLLQELLQLNFKLSVINKPTKTSFKKADFQSILYQIGYRCPGFHGDDVGSRDILLAIGWLLAKSSFVSELVKIKLQDSFQSISSFHLGAAQKALNSGNDKTSSQGLKQTVPSSPNGQAKYLVWLMGRLKLTLKALFCEQQGLCAAMHHIHEATQGVSMPHPSPINHLTAWETFILRHPKQLQQYLLHLDKQASLLQACVTWKEAEPVFWQWMVSVHEAKLSSDPESAVPPISSNNQYAQHMVATTKLSRRLQQLDDLENELTRECKSLEDELESRGVNDLVNQLSDQSNIHKRKVDMDNAVRAQLTKSFEEHRKKHTKNFPLSSVQFSFKPGQTKNARLKAEPLPPNTLNISDEIKRMSDVARRLEEELDTVKLKQQQILDGFAEGLMNVVCIPPMLEKTSYSSSGT
ncbi:tubulin epsilon and delta complex protein 1-like [Lytechinus variegatus]|uniref:tubulin epsilon and delta complex protein 1-like n=1 Tax=Lytechinus variegatus TaxID=7654 RepID=UPI001BB13F01|nr:tubulin epsilon and delta complex protein 1-like [Lytechinus variegatus]